MDKRVLYQKAFSELQALIGGSPKYTVDRFGAMDLITQVLSNNLPYFAWVGFYRVTSKSMLTVGPSKTSLTMVPCGTIKFENGVCGACATQEKTIIVPDVSDFPGYIACDSETKSEIVVPVFVSGKLVAVLDVDATTKNCFDAIDQRWLEKIVGFIKT